MGIGTILEKGAVILKLIGIVIEWMAIIAAAGIIACVAAIAKMREYMKNGTSSSLE